MKTVHVKEQPKKTKNNKGLYDVTGGVYKITQNGKTIYRKNTLMKNLTIQEANAIIEARKKIINLAKKSKTSIIKK